MILKVLGVDDSIDRGRRGEASRPVANRYNPFWTADDFARAKHPQDVLRPEILARLPKHHGPRKAPTKVAISIRLSGDVLKHFKRTGRGWQSRIDAALRKIAGLKS